MKSQMSLNMTSTRQYNEAAGLLKVRMTICMSPDSKLQKCSFEVSLNSLPAFILQPKEGKVIVFPVEVEKLFSPKEKYVLVRTIANGDTIGRGGIDVTKEFQDIENNYREIESKPAIVTKERNLDIFYEHQFLDTIKIKLEMQLLGTIEVTDVDEKKVEPTLTVPKPEYDIYEADINGHTLLVKILKTLNPQAGGLCLCEDESKFNLIPNAGVPMNESTHSLFQIPKGPKKTTTSNGTNKTIENEPIKLSMDNTTDIDSECSEGFAIKLGKVDGPSASRARLELALSAATTPADQPFQKPMASKYVQTEKAVGKKKDKKNKKKKR